MRTPPQTLLSTHGAATARSEARRLLMRMGAHVALEDVAGPEKEHWLKGACADSRACGRAGAGG